MQTHDHRQPALWCRIMHLEANKFTTIQLKSNINTNIHIKYIFIMNKLPLYACTETNISQTFLIYVQIIEIFTFTNLNTNLLIQ